MKHIDYFGLNGNPFDLSPDPVFYYLNRQQKTNADTILSLLAKPDAVVILTGGAGTGKTAFVNYLQRKAGLVYFPMPVSRVEDVYNALTKNTSFSIESADSCNPARGLVKLPDNNIDSKTAFALAFDEAQNIPAKLLTDLAMLRKQVLDSGGSFPILFTGHKALITNVSSYLTTGCDSRQNFELFSLKPFDFCDMADMIDFRLRVCERKMSDIFSTDAVKEIYRLSGGVPRLVSNLCGISLIAAFQVQTHVVCVDSIQQAASMMPDALMSEIFESDCERTITRDKTAASLSVSNSTNQKSVALARYVIPICALGFFLIILIFIAQFFGSDNPSNPVALLPEKYTEQRLQGPDEVIYAIPEKTSIAQPENFDIPLKPLAAGPQKIPQKKEDTDSFESPPEISEFPSLKEAVGQIAINTHTPSADNSAEKKPAVEVTPLPTAKKTKTVRQKFNPSLAKAVGDGNAVQVNRLLVNGADPNSTGRDNSPVLITAMEKKHLGIARALLDKGATPDLLDDNNETPLMAAAWNGDNAVANLLIAHHARVNKKNSDGNTALYFTAIKGHEKIADLLLSHGASCNAINKHKKNALMAASWHGHLNIVKKLLKYGAAVNQKDENHWTPLMFAAFHGHKLIVRLLIRSGADISAVNNDGLTAAALAGSQGHVIDFSGD